MNDLSNHPTALPSGPKIERYKHELKRRNLVVETVAAVTPNMLRITLTGEDLSDFVSSSPDDHIKIILPSADGEPERRDYTPRLYDADARRLVLDFALHEAGPAARWALDARPGTALSIGGPRGSAVISGVSRWILIGDETALPAIGRRVEEANPGETIIVIAAVEGPAEEQAFASKAEVQTIYIHRPLSEATDAVALIAALDTVEIKPHTFVWVAAEASVARAIRAHLVQHRGHALPWLKAAGYWVKGKADAHEKIE